MPGETLTRIVIVAVLAVMLAGIAYLCHACLPGRCDPNRARRATRGDPLATGGGRRRPGGVLLPQPIGSVLVAKALSANTGFLGRFPQALPACRPYQDGFLPNGFAHRGRRLVYSQGIIVLAVLSAGLLIAFGGITDNLIPLFAVGAFLAFTMSQAGMVAHWRTLGGEHSGKAMAINAAGAVCTAVTLVVVLVSKFAEGAWVMMLLIPGLLFLFNAVHAHYLMVGREVATNTPLDARGLVPPLVLVPVRGWSSITRKALRFALKISTEIYALHRRRRRAGDGGPGRSCWQR